MCSRTERTGTLVHFLTASFLLARADRPTLDAVRGLAGWACAVIYVPTHACDMFFCPILHAVLV